MILVDPKNEEQANVCDSLYRGLKENGLDVLLDDRQERPGAKFAESDLIGIPVRVTVGRNINEGKVEVKFRNAENKVEVPLTDLIAYIKANY
jgi:prolyl-tRNA synthetase